MITIIATEIIFKWHFLLRIANQPISGKKKDPMILKLYQMMIANNHKNTTCNFVAIANVIIIKTTTWNFGQGSLDRKQHV